jgi:hypothetical protein
MRALAAACLRYFSAWHIANLWQNPHHRAMDHSLPRLTLCLVFLLGAAAGSSRSANSAETAGDQAVAAAARNVQNESALSADLRYRIDAFGHQLGGQGSYQQLGKGPEKLLRLELKIQVADQAITRQEVCGPTFYYIRRESPFAPTSLGRVNLRHVREAIARAPAPIATNPAEVWILLGGLPRLLETLHRNFEFDEPREDALQFTTEGAKDVQSLPVLVVRGRWKKQRLEALQTTSKGPSKDDPEQLPDAVELILGRPDDSQLPLFPYRITYLQDAKSAGGKEGRGGEAQRGMLTLELFNVHRKGDLDPRGFEYIPNGQEVADLTQAYLQRLGLAKPR